jgi:D-alanine-D-alanine ligase
VNPLAGLNPEHSDLPILCGLVGVPYIELIRRIMASAWERVADGGARAGPGMQAGITSQVRTVRSR